MQLLTKYKNYKGFIQCAQSFKIAGYSSQNSLTFSET